MLYGARPFRAGIGMLAVAAAACLCTARPVSAAAIDFSGHFVEDDDVFVAMFSLSTDGLVTLTTQGYALGGFDPLLSVFDASGDPLSLNDDDLTCAAVSPGDTGFCLDAHLVLHLVSGSYWFAVTQSPNSPLGALADGFALEGSGNFTGGPFLDAFGNQRTSVWAARVDGVDPVPSPIPEPTTIGLVATGLILHLRRRRTAPHSETSQR
jgi:hypothetical protein